MVWCIPKYWDSYAEANNVDHYQNAEANQCMHCFLLDNTLRYITAQASDY